jgi:hypothetical protein
MTERLPDESQLLPNVYNSPDETVDEVGSRPLPAREVVRRQDGRATAKFGELTRIVIDKVLLDFAVAVAEGDRTLLVPRQDGSVIIANNRAQARRVIRDPAFGSYKPPVMPDATAP